MNETVTQKKARIYGAGGHSQVIRSVLEESNCLVTEVFDDKPSGKHYASKNVVQGAKVNLDNFDVKGPPLIIAIGNNKERAEIAHLLGSQCAYSQAIHRSAIIAPSATIGKGTVVFAGAIVQPNTSIGEHVIINTSASVDHDNVIGNFVHISPKAALSGHVEVGEGSHVGVGAVIIPKVKVGKWCVIGAGTVVLNDVPDYATMVGNPGRVIKIKGENVESSISKTSKNADHTANAVIIGAGTQGQVYASYILEAGINLIGFIDDDAELAHTEVLGLPVLGSFKDLLLPSFKNKITHVYCPIGNNKLRVEFLSLLKKEGYATPSFIHKSVSIAPNVILGEPIYMLVGNIVMPHTAIGNYVMVNMGSTIAHHVHISDGVFISSGVNVGASMNIKEMAYIGMGVIIMTGVKCVGKNTILGAGTVIIKDVPDFSVMTGNPGKLLRQNTTEL